MNHDTLFLPGNPFAHLEAIRVGERPWSFLDRLKGYLLERTGGSDEGADQLDGYGVVDTVRRPDGSVAEIALTMTRTLILSRPLRVGPGIVIGAGTMLEAGAIVKAPSLIGDGCEIRQGAYIRGEVLVGNHVVVGHVTEVKSAVLMDGTAAGHFAYVGDAILGARVNLGAGTKIANLQFRNVAEIDTGAIAPVRIRGTGGMIDTGRAKLGAVIGDYTEIGCNSVTAPGAVVGARCWIYPNTTLPKGFYRGGALIRPVGAGKVESIDRLPPL
ncbi:MAG: glucose-1-phosphate thymidylyltransferase [Nitrospinae bacterium]|nr:glucose-1-phosphate thymidylyltransferase [Nitrospinota bacterium]